MLTDPEFLKKLEMLFLLTRKTLGGTLKADRRSDKKGAGINFADYSEYHLGDDYRHVDWNIYARLGNLVVKLYELEEDVTVHVILDQSQSMEHKQTYAKQLAAALGYIALSSLDRLAIHSMADTLGEITAPMRGKGRVFSMLNELEAAPLYGSNTNMLTCARAFQARVKRKGICVLISDFFTPEPYREALKLLRWAKHDVFCIQVLDPSELQCSWKGDVELKCIETGQRRKVTIGPQEAARYVKAVKAWNETLKNECAANGIGFVQTLTDVPFDLVIQTILRRGGLVA